MKNTLALTLIALLAGCASAPPDKPLPSTSPVEVGELRAGSGYLNGYLPRATLPNSLQLLPPPPPAGTPEHAADDAAQRASQTLRATARGELATRDVILKFPAAADTFTCSMDLPISEAATPHLNMLLRRTLADAGLATYAAKDHYKRARPFVQLKQSSCSPAEEKHLSTDGAYPSGHAALGWAWALILIQVAPERTDALLKRGYAFGQSRVVCNVHWQSDVDAGRTMGAAAVARLQSDALFNAQLRAAKAEVDAARAKGVKGGNPAVDCAAEAAALSLK